MHKIIVSYKKLININERFINLHHTTDCYTISLQYTILIRTSTTTNKNNQTRNYSLPISNLTLITIPLNNFTYSWTHNDTIQTDTTPSATAPIVSTTLQYKQVTIYLIQTTLVNFIHFSSIYSIYKNFDPSLNLTIFKIYN